MTVQALGSLPNAPLAYVLAQVRFQPILEMHTLVPRIQTELRHTFPRFSEFKLAGIELGSNGPQMVDPVSRWEFASASQRQGVMLLNNSLVFHATEYSAYPAFISSFTRVMEILGKLVQGIFVDRLGLRYIDFVIPSRGESPDLYVVPSLATRLEPGIPIQAYTSVSLTDFSLADGHLVVRYMRGRGMPPLPADLLPLQLLPSKIMAIKDAAAVDTAILDTDRFAEVSVPFEVSDLHQRFEVLHEDTSKAFKAIATPHAMKVWSAPGSTSV